MFLVYGFLFGVATVLIIGPVLFTLLKATWQYGRKAGLAVEAGIMVSDVIVVGICYLGASATSSFINVIPKLWIGIAGVALLLALGFKYILQPGSSLMASVTTKAHHPIAFFTRGLLINTLNPSAFVVWGVFIGNMSKQYGFGKRLLLCLAAAIFGILVVDVIKILTANWIKPYMTPKILDRIYRGIGVMLLAFSIYVAYVTWKYQ